MPSPESLYEWLPLLEGECKAHRHGPGAVVAAATANGWASDDRVAVAVVGNARWRLDSRLTAAEGVLRGWSERGAAVLEDVAGTFALAAVCLDGSRGLVASDRMGTRPVYVREVAGGFGFATRLRALTGRTADWDPQAVFDYLYFHVVPGPETIVPGVRRLLPGECIELESGRVRRSMWWRADFSPSPAGFDSLADECMDTIRAAVARCVVGDGAGAFLSGGIDSSTVAGLLTEYQGKPAPTFSIGFAAEGYDEMEYARVSARHFNTDQHEYYVTPEDVLDAMPRLARHFDEPFGNSSAVPAYYCARMARDRGVRTLLAGDGGDELFAGNTRYVRQRQFAWYGRLPAALRRALVEPILLGIPGGDKVPLLSKLRAYVRQARIPLPERLETWNLLTRIGVESLFSAEFLEIVDTQRPLKLLRQTWEDIPSGQTLDRMLALDWKFTLADNDLRKVTGAAELAGVDVQYPFLDDELVAFSARVPAQIMLKGTQLRYFLKKALTGFLAPETLSKPKHGFGLPFGPWMVEHRGLSEFAGDTLADLDRRKLLRQGMRQRLMGELLPDHPGYYGTLVWVLIMLELWLSEGGDAPVLPN